MTQDFTYLDYAATTPVRTEVRAAMQPLLDERLFGNPSSMHRAGREARQALEDARGRIAAALGVEPRTVVFTSGGTEADNLAVLGAALAARTAERPFRVAVAATEHKAVLDAARHVERLGGAATVLPVDPDGRVDPEALDAAARGGAAVVSVMWVNNETGTINDVPVLAERSAAHGVPFHSDAVQAVGKIPVRLPEAVSLLSLSGHKIGGPKGVGALVVRDARRIAPLLHGGGQQDGVRPGTENVAGAVGLGVAVEFAVAEQEAFARDVATLRDRLERNLRTAIPDVLFHGAGAARAPHVSSVSFPGVRSDVLLQQLDLAGIACSAGSACTTGSVKPSHVLHAMAVDPAVAIGALRVSLARRTTPAEIDRVVDVMPDAVRKAR
ncbi:MAG: cysteine desulfurase family protein, partial [Gemmatimonadales bacterium]